MSVSIDPRAHFRSLAAERLRVLLPTLAGQIRTSTTFPTQGAGQTAATASPAIIVYCDRIRSADLSNGIGIPAFRSVVTLAVVLRYEQRLTADVETKLDILAHAVRNGLLTDPQFLLDVETVEQVEVSRTTRAEGEHPVGQDVVTFDLRCTEQFEPVLPDILESLRIFVDAADPADRLGAYPGVPGFPPPEPPPRPQGPDGRVEAEIHIDFPQS